MRYLITRAQKICIEDATEENLRFLRDMFRQNGYPESFIDVIVEQSEEQHKKENVGKKAVYISLPIRGDTPADVIYHRLSRAADKVFQTVKVTHAVKPER